MSATTCAKAGSSRSASWWLVPWATGRRLAHLNRSSGVQGRNGAGGEPPHAGRALLRPLPAFRAVTALLDKYTYFDSRLLVHADPVYMYTNRADWTAYNAGADGRECEGSAWIGALHDPLPGGAPVDLFKSWAQRRRAEPKNIILERRFQHPLIDPRAIAAARVLRAHQGHGGLWFSGAYTTGSDLQETALYSAMQVAERLAPSSENLTALQARARAKGLAQVSYDL